MITSRMMTTRVKRTRCNRPEWNMYLEVCEWDDHESCTLLSLMCKVCKDIRGLGTRIVAFKFAIYV